MKLKCGVSRLTLRVIRATYVIKYLGLIRGGNSAINDLYAKSRIECMQRKYAVVYPAFSIGGDGLADMPWLIIAPIHKLMYENICGYSLGHTPTFCNTLDEAKGKCSQQDAIIEFDVEADKVIKLQHIHTISTFKNGMREIPDAAPATSSGYRGKLFEQCNIPVWECKEVRPEDITSQALDTLGSFHQKSQKNMKRN